MRHLLFARSYEVYKGVQVSKAFEGFKLEGQICTNALVWKRGFCLLSAKKLCELSEAVSALGYLEVIPGSKGDREGKTPMQGALANHHLVSPCPQSPRRPQEACAEATIVLLTQGGERGRI